MKNFLFLINSEILILKNSQVVIIKSTFFNVFFSKKEFHIFSFLLLFLFLVQGSL